VLFFVSLALSLYFLEPPWSIVVPVAAALVEGAQWLIYSRLRNRPAKTGAEAMAGKTGIAVTDCNPTGQVKLEGRVWKASSRVPVAAGTPVVVTSVDGLELRVAPLGEAAPEVATDEAGETD
jgi:membrane protein implicated in regulation of membrane protease activity